MSMHRPISRDGRDANSRRGGRLSAEQIRSATFDRTPIGRRGLPEDAVTGFLHRVAEELAARDQDVAVLAEQNRRLKGALRDWQADHGGEPAPEQQVSAEAVTLMARAQEQIDAQLAQADLVAKQTVQQAQQRYEQIVTEARDRANREADRVAHAYRASAGTGYSADQEQLRRQQVYLQALLQALDAVAAHLNATRQVFAVEVQNLASPPVFASASPAWSWTEYDRQTGETREHQGQGTPCACKGITLLHPPGLRGCVDGPPFDAAAERAAFAQHPPRPTHHAGQH